MQVSCKKTTNQIKPHGHSSIQFVGDLDAGARFTVVGQELVGFLGANAGAVLDASVVEAFTHLGAPEEGGGETNSEFDNGIQN